MALNYLYELEGVEINSSINSLKFESRFATYLKNDPECLLSEDCADGSGLPAEFNRYLCQIGDDQEMYQHFYCDGAQYSNSDFSIAAHLRGLRHFGLYEFENVRSVKLNCFITDDDVLEMSEAFPHLRGFKSECSTSGRNINLFVNLMVLLMPNPMGVAVLDSEYVEQICTELQQLEVLDISEQSHLILEKFDLPNLERLEIHVNTLDGILESVLHSQRLETLIVRFTDGLESLAVEMLKKIIDLRGYRITGLLVNDTVYEYRYIWDNGLDYSVLNFSGFAIDFAVQKYVKN